MRWGDAAVTSSVNLDCCSQTAVRVNHIISKFKLHNSSVFGSTWASELPTSKQKENNPDFL